MGLRLLWRDRAFSITVGLTLALCLGANVALFSVVNNVLLRPLPIPESDRLVIVSNAYPNAGAGGSFRAVSVPDYYDRLRETTAFEEQALHVGTGVTLDQNGPPARIRAMHVTPSFFRVLRGQPLLGRTFTEDEGELGNDRKVVLSYGLWQSAFAGDATVVGREVRIDGQPCTIVGVMPQGFVYGQPDVMLWRALAFTPLQKSDDSRHSNNFQQVARLKPGATIERAQAEIDALNAANLDRFPQFKQLVINAGFYTFVNRLQDDLVREVRTTLYLMWGGALFVLLIGSVNVANLVLARTRARLKDLATRAALGAGRARIARQQVAERVLLALASTGAAIAVGWAALRLLGALNIEELPRGSEIRLDWIVVTATLGVGAAIGLLLGLIPTTAVVPSRLTTMLREEGRSGTSGHGVRAIRRALVVAQVAFAFVLLFGASLLVASFQHVIAVDPGFRPDGVLTASVMLPRTRYKDNAALATFLDESLDRLRALPGVAAAGITSNVPLSGTAITSVIFAEGYRMSPGESVVAPAQVAISPGFFEAMGVRLVSGRFFDQRDRGLTPAGTPAVDSSQPRVAIVDDRLARRFWSGQSPIGRRLYSPSDPNNLTAITERTVFIEVVGVVRELKLQSLTQEDQFVGAVYFPAAQYMPPVQVPAVGYNYAIRTTGDPGSLGGAVRAAIQSIDRELAVFDVLPMTDRVARSVINRRSAVVLSAAFGIVALFLSAVGIYGVLAYLVAHRTREIGIRIALGSSGRQVFGLILGEGVGLIAVGFALGATGAFLLRRSLQSQLFGITATDPVVIASAAGILAIVAIAACALPARRATRIDPVVALAE